MFLQVLPTKPMTAKDANAHHIMRSALSGSIIDVLAWSLVAVNGLAPTTEWGCLPFRCHFGKWIILESSNLIGELGCSTLSSCCFGDFKARFIA